MSEDRKRKKRHSFQREKLPRRFIARKLFGWTDKRYDKEYWARLERNWRQWKGGRKKGQRMMETIKEKKEKN